MSSLDRIASGTGSSGFAPLHPRIIERPHSPLDIGFCVVRVEQTLRRTSKFRATSYLLEALTFFGALTTRDREFNTLCWCQILVPFVFEAYDFFYDGGCATNPVQKIVL